MQQLMQIVIAASCAVCVGNGLPRFGWPWTLTLPVASAASRASGFAFWSSCQQEDVAADHKKQQQNYTTKDNGRPRRSMVAAGRHAVYASKTYISRKC
jgi:hypothetical protein